MTAATAYLRQIMAAAGGAIPLERFMQEALYHPTFGYYAARVGSIGRQGDFATSATLHPGLGQAVAAWAAAHAGEVRRDRRWHLIELGAGTGALAETVLSDLGWTRRSGLTYHIVEVSPALQTAQRAKLGRFGRRVCWHNDMAAAMQAAQGAALIFSNEFVDAFPCVQLVLDAGSGDWREVCVHWPEAAEEPQEVFGAWPRSNAATLGQSSVLTSSYRAGQRVEIHFSFQNWLKSWRQLWHYGRLLTIDYGDEIAAVYQRRPGGTLRAYCRHQRFSGREIYARFGQQDLTADVNFTDLQLWGNDLGLITASLLTQRAFLQKWLPGRLLRRSSRDPRLAFLMDEEGAGTAFKVLEQLAEPRL